jgi:hypothetical protein
MDLLKLLLLIRQTEQMKTCHETNVCSFDLDRRRWWLNRHSISPAPTQGDSCFHLSHQEEEEVLSRFVYIF